MTVAIETTASTICGGGRAFRRKTEASWAIGSPLRDRNFRVPGTIKLARPEAGTSDASTDAFRLDPNKRTMISLTLRTSYVCASAKTICTEGDRYSP
jgi:hypothetical protein